jgi:hypothetical protein
LERSIHTTVPLGRVSREGRGRVTRRGPSPGRVQCEDRPQTVCRLVRQFHLDRQPPGPRGERREKIRMMPATAQPIALHPFDFVAPRFILLQLARAHHQTTAARQPRRGPRARRPVRPGTRRRRTSRRHRQHARVADTCSRGVIQRPSPRRVEQLATSPAPTSRAACENDVDSAHLIAALQAPNGAGPTLASQRKPASDAVPGPTARLIAQLSPVAGTAGRRRRSPGYRHDRRLPLRPRRCSAPGASGACSHHDPGAIWGPPG